MRTIGVDLAAQPKKTWTASIIWTGNSAQVVSVNGECSNDEIIDASRSADKVGIDCPLGWPDPFVNFVVDHRKLEFRIDQKIDGWRSDLLYRRTDTAVRRATGLIPLSVSADKIAHLAIRCAGLLSQMTESGLAVDRSGLTGLIAEVYPAASLKRWAFKYKSYKNEKKLGALSTMFDRLKDAAPWLAFGTFDEICRSNDDAFDAVIAAMTARAVAIGLTTPPDEESIALARLEGWICLPAQDSFQRLVG